MSAAPWIEKVCLTCKEPFRVPPWRADAQYCSRECHAVTQRKGPRDAA